MAEDSLHLTLRFVGACDDEGLARQWRSCSAKTSGPPSAWSCTVLEHVRRTGGRSVVWAGVTEGHAEVTALATRVARAVSSAGFADDPLPFRPHVTLVRSRTAPTNTQLGALAAKAPLGPLRIDRVEVFRSQLAPDGAVYESVASIALG